MGEAGRFLIYQALGCLFERTFDGQPGGPLPGGGGGTAALPELRSTYDTITDLSARRFDLAWVDILPGSGNARCVVHEGIILARRGMSTGQLVDGVARALARYDLGPQCAGKPDEVARLASSRLISLDALALGMALHDGGITAIALDLGVSTVTVRERLNTLTETERIRLRDQVKAIKRDAGGVSCTCLRNQVRAFRTA